MHFFLRKVALYIFLFFEQDTVVFRQQTEGEGPAEAAQFFYLNPDSGVISTKKFLTETTTKTFRVITNLIFVRIIITVVLL